MPLLAATSLSKRFGGLKAVDAVDLAVQPHEIVGVIGPNGAGKSTLFSMLGGMQRPDTGRIVFDGHDVTAASGDAIARLGLVRTFQTPRPFASMTFLDNVMVGALVRHHRVRAARDAAREALERVGLSAHTATPASGASTGQRKRLDIARALACGPSLLLLDEPLAGVDPASIGAMVDLLTSLRAEGMTLVVVEHNIDALTGFADRLVALTLGRKIADGPPAEVLANEALIAAYLGEEPADAAA